MATDMLLLCQKSWPTDSDLLEEAFIAGSPQQKAELTRLVKEVRDAIDCKMQLHYAIWRWHAERGADYKETEWPCDRDNLTAVVGGLEQKEHDRLYSLYILASDGKDTKAILDKMVVEIVISKPLACHECHFISILGEPKEKGEDSWTDAGHVCKTSVNDGVTAEEAEELMRQAQEPRQPRRFSFHHLQRSLGVLPKPETAAMSVTVTFEPSETMASRSVACSPDCVCIWGKEQCMDRVSHEKAEDEYQLKLRKAWHAAASSPTTHSREVNT
ncbi:MAG: hypothetical protein EBS90_10485 [Betaproteobacteria bacterium]|nr:hypothetical protein [Betaproteobacteria bacterium]